MSFMNFQIIIPKFLILYKSKFYQKKMFSIKQLFSIQSILSFVKSEILLLQYHDKKIERLGENQKKLFF